MLTVISIFTIIFTLIAGELYMVYKNYKETANTESKDLNYSSR
ncbi:MAG: hypothetical protein UZ05_CHB002000225 [Chlorobi bacterium OLB5]|nr:MAG: hypothetical protein UZ05_CHB002000225 [Chlorobi bacterium OLB5]